MDLTSSAAADYIRAETPFVIDEINEFLASTFTTRGGRLGSGMGLLLEGLWAYHMSNAISGHGIEIGWIADDMYNDYACLDIDSDWDPATGEGELFRIEAKSMNLGADESKAHFAELAGKIGPDDLLLVITWRWEPIGPRVHPKIVDVFIERARPIAELRDQLHLARGGSFVDRSRCPDGCHPELCQHGGEPLNAAGKRERLSGPESTRPSSRVSFAANFGGLFRMIGVRDAASRRLLDQIRDSSWEADDYVAFVNRARGRLERGGRAGRLD